MVDALRERARALSRPWIAYVSFIGHKNLIKKIFILINSQQ